jgi:hypothetical protein
MPQFDEDRAAAAPKKTPKLDYNLLFNKLKASKKAKKS